MIRSFRSKPLRLFWEKSDGSRIAAQLHARVSRRLDALDQAITPSDLNIPGFDFHPLSGNRAGVYSIHVNGPWCITFGWDGADVIDVDLENYH
ncbi:type II toxin-antitoxin system RelE/ParE family toxin [Rhodopila globiformis]|uniref:Plasmid maintenance system killer protein n=1 Tax=Rhodopila globiformis TaxID=1071 RepID=A0A2S6N954_RHOGL|nr:type II toxin-antitoxin system RelE/ParE family toxin [Rhodopila globiformis]PPQ31140.1 plasmid maintenance system killer protein [Rhodopila globiformis]